MGGIEQVINQIARGASFLGVSSDVLSLTAERDPQTIEIDGAGPIEHELRKQAKDLGLLNIHFLGFLSNEDKVALLILCFGKEVLGSFYR